MKKNPDVLISRLNMISNSSFWPNYYIAKEKITERLRGLPVQNNNLLIPKIKEIAEKRANKNFGMQIRNFSETNRQRKVKILPVVVRKSLESNECFTERLIKIYRMVPSDQITARAMRNTAQPVKNRELKGSYTQKVKIKPSLMSTIEVQTNISDEERHRFESLRYKTNDFTF
jgi:hypothetical protein